MTARKPAAPVMRIGAPVTGRPPEARRVPSMAPVVSCANKAPGTKSTAASSTASLRLLPQHGETADRVSKRATHEDVRQKMGRERKPRETDQGRHTICRVGNPAVISIAARNDRGDRKCRDAVAGWETSGAS